MAVSDISNSDLTKLIEDWIKSERDRQILKRRLIDGVTFSELAAAFYLSERQVKNIVYRGEQTIFKHL